MVPISYSSDDRNPKMKEISQYKGVYFHKNTKKWFALIYSRRQKPNYGGLFDYEIDAAKGVNELCKSMGIPLQNPGVDEIPILQYQEKSFTIVDKDISKQKNRLMKENEENQNERKFENTEVLDPAPVEQKYYGYTRSGRARQGKKQEMGKC